MASGGKSMSTGESLRLAVSWHGIRWEKYEYLGKVLGWEYLGMASGGKSMSTRGKS